MILPTFTKADSSRGMTMIEVLVAMAILSMMIISVWSSYGTTARGMEVMEKVQDRYSSVRNAVDRVSSEISTAYLSFNRPSHETRFFTLFEGRSESGSDSLTFSSFSHLRIRKDSKEGDQAVLQYFLAEDPEDSSRKHLYRRETRRLTGDRPEDLYRFTPAYVLCEDVEELEFKYWDPLRQEWIDEWRTTVNDAQPGRLPPRVMITLKILNSEGEPETFITQTTTVMQEKIDFSK